MSEAEKWFNRLQTLERSTDVFQVELSQINAKALLQEIVTESPVRWNYLTSRLVRNLTGALVGLETIANSDRPKLVSLIPFARKVAAGWESLAKLGEQTDRNTALLNAAVAYEIAGYQANSSCLSRMVKHDFRLSDSPTILNLASAFLQRYFVLVREITAHGITTDVAELYLKSSLLGKDSVSLMPEGFEMASKYFLTGELEFLDSALRSLKEFEEAAARSGLVREYNIVKSVRNLLPIMKEKSTWAHLGALIPDNPRWNRYLRLLARGIGRSIIESRSVSELWPSQIHALEGGLLDGGSKILKMPTSAGKTRIAELAIVHTLLSVKGSKCVYIAPYRALVWELEQSFLNLFADLGFQVSSIIGTFESDKFENQLMEDADILVLTPEKLDLLQRISPEFLENVRLIILDEGQIVNDSDRGVKFELLLTRLKRKLPRARFLFLSAVVPQQTLEDFARWLRADVSRDVMISDWRPSIQRYAGFDWKGDKGTISYVPQRDVEVPEGFVPGVINVNQYRFLNTETGRINTEIFPEKRNYAQVSAELALVFSELGPVLVFCSQRNGVEAVAKAIEHRLSLSKLTGKNTSPHFSPANDLGSIAISEQWLGKDHIVTRLLKCGIALHHGGLPDAIRKAIEIDFRNREYRVLIATNTLAQGVNLPIKTVIFHSWKRYLGERKWQRLPARDYWNIAGRAGRAGEETEGTVIHLNLNPLDMIDFSRYNAARHNVEPVESALYSMLKDLIDERISIEEAKQRIDPEVLAMLVEEAPDLSSIESISGLLADSLTKIQAERTNQSPVKLWHVFDSTGSDISNRVRDKTTLRLFSNTGLSLGSCELLRSYVERNRQVVKQALLNTGNINLKGLIDMILEACLQLQEMQPRGTFGGNYNELLFSWMQGIDIPRIASSFSEETISIEDLASFISDFFSYKLPWGASAFLNIASQILEISEDNISSYVRSLPSMMKYGVPIPVAAWAMSAGIPYREAAKRIAEKFLIEFDTYDGNDFLVWLGKLTSEELNKEFGMSGNILKEVTVAIAKSGSNPLLASNNSILEILPHETWVRGIKYGDRRLIVSGARAGQKVRLARDYDNVVDRNAIEVLLEGKSIGFLDRQLAQLASLDLDCGTRLSGEIIDIERHEVPEVRIRIFTSN